MAHLCKTDEAPNRTVTPPLPPDTIPLQVQAAGHFYGKKGTKLGMLQLLDGTLVKPVIPPKGEKERIFYEDIYRQENDSTQTEVAKTFLPKYFGIWTTPLHPNVNYLKLENITQKYSQPCVMDVKVGPRTWQPGASDEKIKSEVSKYPQQPVVGFRILGIKVYNPSTGSYNNLDHMYMRTISEDEIVSKGIATYINIHENRTQKLAIIDAFLRRLRVIQQWFETQKIYHFYASSLLFVYEGDMPDCQGGNVPGTLSQDTNSSNSSNCSSQGIDLRLIDFTHVFEAEGKIDSNYLTGVNRLIHYFTLTKELLEK